MKKRMILLNCKQFNKKILRRKRLCYGCYLPVSADHTAKTCKKKIACNICTMKHPTDCMVMYTDGKVVEQVTIAKMVIVTL